MYFFRKFQFINYDTYDTDEKDNKCMQAGTAVNTVKVKKFDFPTCVKVWVDSGSGSGLASELKIGCGSGSAQKPIHYAGYMYYRT